MASDSCLSIYSSFSPQDSLVRLSELVTQAQKSGYKTLGLCDLMSVDGVAEFVLLCREAGLRGLAGVTFRVAPFPAEGFVWRLGRMRVFARSERGWLRLLNLLARAQERSNGGEVSAQHVTYEDLLENTDGLIFVLGDEQGEVARLLQSGDAELAGSIIKRFQQATEANQLFLGLPSPGIKPGLCARLAEFAEANQVKVCAMPAVRCTLSEDDVAFRIVSDRSSCDGPSERSIEDYSRPQNEREHLRSPQELGALYEDFPAALEGLGELERQINWEFRDPAQPFPKSDFARGVDADSYIWNGCFGEAQSRYQDSPVPWRERLNEEFALIVEKGVPNGLIWIARVLEEFDAAKIHYGPGLGSYSTSLVCSLLGLTRLEPFQLGTAPITLDNVTRQLTIRIAPNQRRAAEEVLRRLLGNHCFGTSHWVERSPREAIELAAEHLGLSVELKEKMLATKNWDVYSSRERLTPAGQEPAQKWLFNDARTLAWLSRRLKGLPVRAVSEPSVFGLAETHSCVPLVKTKPKATPLPVRLAEGKFRRLEAQDLRTSPWSSAQCAALGGGVIRLQEDSALQLLAHATYWIRQEGEDQFTPEDLLLAQSNRIWDALGTDSLRGIEFLEAPGLRLFLGQKKPRSLGQLLAALKDWNEAHNLALAESEFCEQAVIALMCLVVKLQYPLPFAAGLLSTYLKDSKRQQAFVHELYLKRTEIKPLDINCSASYWSPEGNALRPGLCQVRTLTLVAREEIESVRQEMNFSSLKDFLQRTDPEFVNAEQVMSLIHAGAFDSLAQNRGELLQQFQRLSPVLRPVTLPRSATSFSHFFNPESSAFIQTHAQVLDMTPPGIPEEVSTEQLLQQEHSATSIQISASPCYFYSDLIAEANILTTLPQRRKSKRPIVSLIGPVSSCDPCPPRADVGGYAEVGTSLVRITQHQWHQLHERYQGAEVMVVTGRLHDKMICLEALRWDLPEEAQRLSLQAELLTLFPQAPQPALLKELYALCKAYPGSTPVRVPSTEAKPPRIVQKLNTRKITWCPAFEEELRLLISENEYELRLITDYAKPDSSDLSQPTAEILSQSDDENVAQSGSATGTE